MTTVVIGLGSMGRRRIRLLKKYDDTLKIIGIDNQKERCEKVEKDYEIITYIDLMEACNKESIDCAFISTSPLTHANLISICLKNDMHVFTELNLTDTLYDENINLAKERNRVLFLSSTFLYRREIMYMHDEMHSYAGRVNYMYHAGQYLPDWHPWESYKNFFVGQKKTNGCREFMAIEFPWLIEVFGKIKSVEAIGDKMSELEVDFPDNYILFFEHENGNKGVIIVDVVSRKASRNLEIVGEHIYIIWDGTPNGLWKYDYDQKENVNLQLYETIDKRDEYSASIIEDAYYSEICNFFQVIVNKEKPKYSFEQDREVLKTIDFIEKNVGGIINEYE